MIVQTAYPAPSSRATPLTGRKIGNGLKIVGHFLNSVFKMLPNLYDVYIGVPLRIERMLRGGDDDGRSSGSGKRGTREGSV